MSSPASSLTVAVLGAGGRIAPALVRDLADSPEVAIMRLLDIAGDRAAAVAGAHGLGKAESVALDARSDDLAVALEGCDVLANCASYRLNVDAMQACLKAGCHYLDLGGLYWMTGKQLELDERFREAGLLALLGMGSSPGKTNVMAARAARELPTVEALHVSAGGRDLDPPPGFSVPYALVTLIDELTMSPVVLHEGDPIEIEPLSPGGQVDFGSPIGRSETIHTLHSELRTFGDSFGCREASFRLSLPEALLARLVDLSKAPPAERERADREALAPSPRTVSTHVVEALGDGRRVRVTATTEPVERWGFGGSVVSTAAPAAAAIRLLAHGRLEARGALPSERCVDPDDLFPELEGRGCEFRIEVDTGIESTELPSFAPEQKVEFIS
jgi:saccharopine dehydrogenase-like NADP-dependent oxidoreductase